MSKFHVLTYNDRNLVIEAETFFLNRDNEYEFEDEDGCAVASVPNSPNIFAVVRQENQVADFYFSDHSADDKFSPQFGHANLARSSAGAQGPDSLPTPKTIRTTLTDAEWAFIRDHDGGYRESVEAFLAKNNIGLPEVIQ